MIVDTSAIMAVLLGEPEASRFAAAILEQPDCSISAGTWLELSAVAVRRRYKLEAEIERFISSARITIVPVSAEQAAIGRDAYRTYGRGTGHPARLNFGDCFAYALAKAIGQPLLFKGDDFSRTDIQPAYS
jgi:ribonuclease VapC